MLRQELWRHIILRHPGLKNAVKSALEAVAHTEEVYLDLTGAFHALKRVGDVSDFSGRFIASKMKGYLRTAYHTSNLERYEE